MSQAKQQVDDATARATAIHDGGERRLNLLISRHTETVRRLTEIRDVVTSLVSGETARGSLEEEVNRALGVQQAGNGAVDSDARPSAQPEQGPAVSQRNPRQAAPADGRRTAAAPREDPAEPAPAHAPASRQPAAAAARTVHAVAPAAREDGHDDPLATPSQRTPARPRTKPRRLASTSPKRPCAPQKRSGREG